MAKADALWSEDERKQFKEYEKKVKELNEERDKYRKVGQKINVTSLDSLGHFLPNMPFHSLGIVI
jgi:uncharacterized protein YydD (DUF2326 family)